MATSDKNIPGQRDDRQASARAGGPVVTTGLPAQIHVSREEIAILRVFLASEMEDILHPAARDLNSERRSSVTSTENSTLFRRRPFSPRAKHVRNEHVRNEEAAQ
jgi:hypothetical protein